MALRWSSTTFLGLTVAAALLSFPSGSDGVQQPNFRAFSACAGNLGVTAAVFIQGCTESVCMFCRKTSVDIQLKFTSATNTTGLFVEVFVTITKSKIKVGKETDVCSGTVALEGPSCADTQGLRQGTTYVYIREFNVKEKTPKINGTVEIQLYSKDGKSKVPVACVRIPVQIRDCPAS